MSNLFTSVLNGCTSDAQFEFRKGQSTVDALFALQSIVQMYLNRNQRLYVTFIDLKKCFDSIYRNGMWLKLFKTGIQSKMLRIVKTMYAKVKSCVKSCTHVTHFQIVSSIPLG